MKGITIAWVEEAQYVSEESWAVLTLTIRKRAQKFADAEPWQAIG